MGVYAKLQRSGHRCTLCTQPRLRTAISSTDQYTDESELRMEIDDAKGIFEEPFSKYLIFDLKLEFESCTFYI